MAVHMQKLVAFRAGETAAKAHAALKTAVDAMEEAEHCAVLWFGDIRSRRLFRELGYSSINQYAAMELNFSRTKTGDFIQLADKLDDLPAVREAVTRGEIGYTKAREIVKVATARTEKAWLDEAATSSRRELEQKVSQVRKQARAARQADPNQGELLSAAAVAGAMSPEAMAKVPVRVSLEMSAEQFAHYEALWERLYKLGGVPAGVAGKRGKPSGRAKADVILEGLAALAESLDTTLRSAPRGGNDVHRNSAPRGGIGTGNIAPPGGTYTANLLAPGPHFQIHVHKCPECEKATVQTSRGELTCSQADLARAECDSRVKKPGKRNKATIPPAVRRAVLARDRFRCQAPGCGNTRFLEVHHLAPRKLGGGNGKANLLTLCASCHGLVHKKGSLAGRMVLPPERGVDLVP